MNMFARLTTTAAIAVLAALLTTGITDTSVATAAAQPADRGTVIHEDDPAWDCRTNGNEVCGPTNDQGMTAGQYTNGVLVPWPINEVPVWCRDICLGA